MTEFYPSQGFVIDTEKHYGYLRFKGRNFRSKFWKQEGVSSFKALKGVYVFGIAHGNRTTPIYVGMTTKTFQSEAFQAHKIDVHYLPALRVRKNGKAVMIFLWHRHRKKPNLSAIDALETELIRHAGQKKINLSNSRKTKTKALKIFGVRDFKTGKKPRGKSSPEAARFREIMQFD